MVWDPVTLSTLGQHRTDCQNGQSFSPRGRMGPGRTIPTMAPDMSNLLHVYITNHPHISFLHAYTDTDPTSASCVSTQTPTCLHRHPPPCLFPLCLSTHPMSTSYTCTQKPIPHQPTCLHRHHPFPRAFCPGLVLSSRVFCASSGR